MIVNQFFVLERVVHLRVRHGSRVEPNVNQVFLAVHRLSRGGYQYDIIHVRTVQIDLVVILFRVITYLEVLERAFFHDSRLDCFLDFFR